MISATILQNFRSILTGAAGITALVGQRIYADQAPQGAMLPTIIYTIAGSPTFYLQDGSQISDTLIQLDIDGTSATQCRSVLDAVNTVISGQRITQGSTSFGGIFHEGSEFTSVHDGLTEGTTQLFRLSADFRVQHTPSS